MTSASASSITPNDPTAADPAPASPRYRPSRRGVVLGVLSVAATAACTTAVPSQGSSPPGPGGRTAAGPGGAGQALPSTAHTTATSTQPAAPDQQPPASAPATPGLADPGPDIVNGARTGTFVALTFHGAGDLALTARALTVARDTGAMFTVFAVGQWLAANPTVGRDITVAGHDLGNHTWSHQPMTQLNQAQATREIQLGSDAVTRSIGSPGLLFRPSGTPASTPTIRAAAQTCGYRRCISYDVDPLDYTDPGPDLVRARVLAAVQPGSIVSLHLGHPGTIDALPGLLQGLTAKGLTCVTLTRLLTAAT